MNDVWSKYVQGANTLHYSRKLRFDDIFSEQYKALFNLNALKKLKILEIGCGTGALASSLGRWYPNAEITATDRDSEFIKFASTHSRGAKFIECDATALPFEEGSFDVAISNTVAEHIEPSRFYSEQLRVLKEGGICLVLVASKGVKVEADCLADSNFERGFWEKAAKHDNTIEKYSVGKYRMNEAQLPTVMQKYGFKDISTGYAVIDLTPDNPKYSAEMAREMINAERYLAMDAISAVRFAMPQYFSAEDFEEMTRLANAKYDERLAQYNRGEKQWDTAVSVTMAVRGVKPITERFIS